MPRPADVFVCGGVFTSAVVLLACAAAAAGQRAPCRIGQEPGIWRADNRPGMHFEGLDPRCALVDYASNNDTAALLMQQLAPRVLWLSDSVDYYMLTEFCTKYLKGEMVMQEKTFDSLQLRKEQMGKRGNESRAYRTSMWSHTCLPSAGGPFNRTKFLHNFLISVGKTGPFWFGLPLGGWHKLLDARTAWDAFSELPPDVIVTSTTLWELGRMTLKYNATGSLPAGAVDAWAREFAEFIAAVRRVFPGVPLLHRAHLTPHINATHAASTGQYPVAHGLGTLAQFHELNMAGAHAAAGGQVLAEEYEYAASSTRARAALTP